MDFLKITKSNIKNEKIISEKKSGKDSDASIKAQSEVSDFEKNQNDIREIDIKGDTSIEYLETLENNSAIPYNERIKIKKQKENIKKSNNPEGETLRKNTTDTLETFLQTGKETLKEQDKEDGIVAKTANKVREFFGAKASKKNVQAQFEEQENFIEDLKNASSDEEFAEIYKKGTGVDYNPEKIEEFVKVKQYSSIAQSGLAKCSEFEEALSKETLTGEDLINATQKYFSCSKEEAIDRLNEYAKKNSTEYRSCSFDKDGNLTVETLNPYRLKEKIKRTYKPNEVGSENQSHKEGDVLSQAYISFRGYAKDCTKEFGKNFEKATGKSLKEVSDDYTKTAKEALGNSGFNGELVKQYCEKQETVADRVSTGVSIAGMGMMVGGYAAVPVTGGASLVVAQVGTGMAIGGQFADEALDLVDEVTSENGLSKEEGLALLKETATDAALISSGFAINKVSNGVNQLVLTKLGSKVVAKTAEVGADAAMGLYADYIITGDIDIQGEGLSQGMAIISGISLGKAAKIKSTKVKANGVKTDLSDIKNPVKTHHAPLEAKNVSDMSLIEKTARGVDTPQKIITLDSTVENKQIIKDVNNKVNIVSDYDGEFTRIPQKDGYIESEVKSFGPYGGKEKVTEYNSKENSYKITETETRGSHWDMTEKNVTVKDRKYAPNGELKSETTTKTSYSIEENKDVFKHEELTSIDYIHGSKIEAKYAVDGLNRRSLQSQTRTYTNPKTGKMETQVLEMSDVSGVYNSKIIDANGKEKIESFAKKNQDGSIRVEKNLESIYGTKTKYLYEASSDNSSVKSFYQIISDDGKVLSTVDREFTRIDSTRSRSSVNGHEYLMTKVNDGIEVYDVVTEKTTQIKYSDILKEDNNSMRSFVDKMSADQLLDLKNRDVKLSPTKTANSYFNTTSGDLVTEYDLFTFSHELGHAKDVSYVSHKKEYAIAENDNFRKTFDREKAEFKKAFPDVQEEYIDYFIKGPYGDADAGAAEAVAEINAMFSAGSEKDYLAIRTYYLQKYFPETIAEASKHLNNHSNIALLSGTKINDSTLIKQDFVKAGTFYDRMPVANSDVSTKLQNFGISNAEFDNAVKTLGKEQAMKNVELLAQLKSLNTFRDAKLTLDEVPKIYETIKGRAENTIDFEPENLLSAYEKTLPEELKFEREVSRDLSFDEAVSIYKSLNTGYVRATDDKALTNIGNRKNIICKEAEISKAKPTNPQNPQSFVDCLIESNLTTKELLNAYDNMSKSSDPRAKEIMDAVSAREIKLEDASGMVEMTNFETIYKKAKTDYNSLSPAEIHGITDTFKSEVRKNKESTRFFDGFFNKEIYDSKGELLPQHKQISGSVDSMKNISKKILGNNIEIKDHAFMRLIDRDLINPTNANGKLVSFEELVSEAKLAVTKSNGENTVLKGLYSSEGKEISLIVKKTETGKISIESFM